MQKLMALSYVVMVLIALPIAVWLGEAALAWLLCDLLNSRIC